MTLLFRPEPTRIRCTRPRPISTPGLAPLVGNVLKEKDEGKNDQQVNGGIGCGGPQPLRDTQTSLSRSRILVR